MTYLNALSELLSQLKIVLIAIAATTTATYPVYPPPVGIPPAIASNLRFNTSTLENSPSWVDAYVREQAKALGVNPDVAGWIVAHESQDGRNLTGDDGNSRGYWQISKIYHPEVSNQCAYDLPCSTKWALQQLLAGKAGEWTTYRYCRQWFHDCPF